MITSKSITDIKEISMTAYNFLENHELSQIPIGRYDLGNGIYVNVEEYETKSLKEGIYESHRKYIDILLIISGTEMIRVSTSTSLKIVNTYCPHQDITFYANDDTGEDIILSPGEFLILYPDDAHMPCLRVDWNKPEKVKKVIIKIPISLLKNIKYLIMDVDGTLTDGKIYMGDQGEISKAFHIKDGCGIKDYLYPAGIIPVIITGRTSKIVENRCLELGITQLYQGISNKTQKLKEILEPSCVEYSNVAYIGDDINDLDCMEIVKKKGGLIGCPADATESVLSLSDFISSRNGGNGAVREFIEWIIVGK